MPRSKGITPSSASTTTRCRTRSGSAAGGSAWQGKAGALMARSFHMLAIGPLSKIHPARQAEAMTETVTERAETPAAAAPEAATTMRAVVATKAGPADVLELR